MPSIFEQLAAAGVELSDEQKAAIKLDEADEVVGLKSKTSELMTEAKEAKRKARELELAMQRAEEEGAKKAGDLAGVEKAVTDRIRQEFEPVAHERDALKAMLVGSKKAQVVSSLAMRLTDPDIADDLFGSKVVVEIEGDSVSLKYLDVNGNPVASNEDDYLKYAAKVSKYARYLIGTSSTGGGATGSSGRGGAAAKKFADMTGSELVALRRENPSEYARLVAESKQ